MTSPFMQLTRQFLLLAVVCVLRQLCVIPALAQSADPIVGTWVRVGDEFRGYVIEIYRLSEGRFEARTLHAPLWTNIDGFAIGEKHFRSIAARGDGTYVAEGLRWNVERLEYKPGEFSVVDSDRLLYLCENSSEGFEERQKWRRIKSTDTLYAFVEFGRGMLAAEQKEFNEASMAIERAAEIIMKDYSQLAVSNLANEVAWTLAADKRTEIRNPVLANKLLPALGDWYAHLDTAAVVYAANGDFTNASILQQKALKGAKSSNALDVFMENHQADKDILVKRVFAEVIVRRWLPEMEERTRLYDQHLPYIEK